LCQKTSSPKQKNTSTLSARRSFARLTVTIRLITPLVPLTLRLCIKAIVGVSRLVLQISINPHQFTAILRDYAAHVDLARAVAVALTVAARAVDFAVVFGIEVDNVYRAAAVVLNDLVGGVVGAAADDVGGPGAFDADGVFADVFEPDVFEGAGACCGRVSRVVES
jgi:hypothetical protein